MPSRKRWSDLTPGYRARLERQGITEELFDDAMIKLTFARGHATTPEHPEDAVASPTRFRRYAEARETIEDRVQTKKKRLYGESFKFRDARSWRAVKLNPRTQEAPLISYMRRFLDMSDDEALLIDWSDDEWGFLFYH